MIKHISGSISVPSINSEPVKDHPDVLQHCNNPNVFQKRLLANHKDDFLRIFGRQNSTFTSEYRHWVWLLEFEGSRYLLFSGRRGTGLEIIVDTWQEYTQSHEFGAKTIRLINELIGLLEKSK